MTKTFYWKEKVQFTDIVVLFNKLYQVNNNKKVNVSLVWFSDPFSNPLGVVCHAVMAESLVQKFGLVHLLPCLFSPAVSPPCS